MKGRRPGKPRLVRLWSRARGGSRKREGRATPPAAARSALAPSPHPLGSRFAPPPRGRAPSSPPPRRGVFRTRRREHRAGFSSSGSRWRSRGTPVLLVGACTAARASHACASSLPAHLRGGTRVSAPSRTRAPPVRRPILTPSPSPSFASSAQSPLAPPSQTFLVPERARVSSSRAAVGWAEDILRPARRPAASPASPTPTPPPPPGAPARIRPPRAAPPPLASFSRRVVGASPVTASSAAAARDCFLQRSLASTSSIPSCPPEPSTPPVASGWFEAADEDEDRLGSSRAHVRRVEPLRVVLSLALDLVRARRRGAISASSSRSLRGLPSSRVFLPQPRVGARRFRARRRAGTCARVAALY